jgi:hypothetical protein
LDRALVSGFKCAGLGLKLVVKKKDPGYLGAGTISDPDQAMTHLPAFLRVVMGLSLSEGLCKSAVGVFSGD